KQYNDAGGCAEARAAPHARKKPVVPRQGRRKDAIGVYRVGDFLQRGLTDILEWNLDNLANLIVDGLRDANSSRLGKLLEANGNVYSGAVEGVVLGNHVAQIDADAELHPFVLGDGNVALGNLVLDLDSAANGFDDARELGDEAVACAAEDATLMSGDRLLHHSTVHAQIGRGGLFVPLCKAAIALHIGSENRSKPTFHGERNSNEQRQMENTHIWYIRCAREAR